MEQHPGESHPLLLSERQRAIPAVWPIKRVEIFAQATAGKRSSDLAVTKHVRAGRIADSRSECPKREIRTLRQEHHAVGIGRRNPPAAPGPKTGNGSEQCAFAGA